MNNQQMTALVPYNDRGRQAQNEQYDKRIIGQQPFIPYLYPPIQNYQQTFYPMQGFLPHSYNNSGRSAMSTDLISVNQSNKHYQYAQLMRHVGDMQTNYWKQYANTMPVTRRSDALSAYNRPRKLYRFEKETRYLPFPVYGQGPPGYGLSGNLGYGYPSNSGLVGRLNNGLVNVGGIRNLPPKVRVIFIPQGTPSIQQPCSGALAMPPFAFNRMSQPLCSLPLPPPLPQIGSLPLSPQVQQMVIEQYANPVAILPFSPNWASPQSVQSGCLPLSVPQQQYNVPPVSIPASLPVFANNTPSYPFASYANSAGPQYPQNNFPSTCRACIPPPPPLNVPVASHCWTQHCTACRHIFGDANKPNTRPTNGRSTPLLRQPTVTQNTYKPRIQKQLYPHTNASFATRPWAHKLPSLPQGAVIISDQYFPIPRRNSAKTYKFSQKYPVQHPSTFISASRSISLATPSTNTNKSTSNGSITRSQQKYQNSNTQSRSISTSITPVSQSTKSNKHRSLSSSSSSSSCSECKALAANRKEKSDLDSQNSQQNLARKQLSAAARNINLRYNYQTPDLPAVYHNNRYLRSSDTDSPPSLSPSGSSPNNFVAKEYTDDKPPSPVYLNAIQEEDEEEKKTIQSHSMASFKIPQPATKKLIKNMRPNSPSTVSTISMDSLSNLTENDADSISITVTIHGEAFEDTTEDISERL